MLGRLAKWLRVMGFDIHYQSYYKRLQIEQYVREGRLLLSRHRKTIELYSGAVFIESDHVRDQIFELKKGGYLKPDSRAWFTRCLSCNLPLEKIDPTSARENVPEYIFYENPKGIRRCPSCKRYFWPGTHRKKMVRQLTEWGLGDSVKGATQTVPPSPFPGI